MRKTRLVILPTKCLHQMGFLLLFLSCPVIGDWGRIRPESENSHNAIQIDREGTCGLERDPPGGLLDFLNETGLKQCRLSKTFDLNLPSKISKQIPQARRNDERLSQERNIRRVALRRDVRQTNQRLRLDERRDVRLSQRNVRSRSVESRRLPSNRNEIRARSLSLSRLENVRTVRNQRTEIRQGNEEHARAANRRLHLTRKVFERQTDRQVERQNRLNREVLNELRENQRAPERREREVTERGRVQIRRDSNRRSFEKLSVRTEKDMTKREAQERVLPVRERSERRLSLSRRESNNERRTRDKRIAQASTSENRNARSLENLENNSDRRENSARNTRNPENVREIENRRVMRSFPKVAVREDIRDRLVEKERTDRMKSRKAVAATMRRESLLDVSEQNFGQKNAEKDEFGEVTNWINLKGYENYKTGDWTANCVIGAVVYFLTTRQAKTA